MAVLIDLGTILQDVLLRTLTIEDFVEPPIVAALWLIVSWLWARGVNGTFKIDRLTNFQKVGIFYGAWFFLGASFLLNLAGALRLSDAYWFGLVAAWAMILAVVACYRRRASCEKPSSFRNGQ